MELGVEFTQVFFCSISRANTVACPEEIAVLVTGGEGGGEVVGLSAADI